MTGKREIHRRFPTPSLLLLLTALTLVPALAGCSQRTPPTQSVDPVRVLATVFPLADLTRMVGGKFANVDWVVEDGQSLAAVDVTPDLRTRVHDADIVIGGGVADNWAFADAENPFRAAQLIRVDAVPAAKALASDGLPWLDPKAAEDACRALGEKLAARRPALGPYFSHSAAQAAASIESVVQEFAARLPTTRPAVPVLVMSGDFNPLLRRFNIEPVRVFTERPPVLGEQQIADLKANANGTRAIVVVPIDLSQAAADDLANRSGLRVIRLDPLGSSASTGHDSYLSMLRYNLQQLTEALHQSP